MNGGLMARRAVVRCCVPGGYGGRMDRVVAETARVTRRSPGEVYADFAAQTALGRFVEESHVAAAIRFLVFPGARNITGHDIPVDASWDV